MTRRAQERPTQTALTEAEVAEYLSAHPGFFDSNPSVLLDLELHHQPGGAAVSLVQRQVAMLRTRNEELQSQLNDFIAVAKDNQALVEKIHQLAISLMAEENAARRLQVLSSSLREDFSVERAVLVLFAAPQADSEDDRFLKVVDRGDPGLKPFASFLKSARPRCGALRRAQKRFAFGDVAADFRSAALIPLGAQADLGFIVIGSADPDYYHAGKRTDYLGQLGEVVSMALLGEGGTSGARSGPRASGS